MPDFFETRMGRAFYERDVPEIARQLARIAAALERLATADGEPQTTAAPAGGEDPRGGDRDDPQTPGA